MVKTAQYKLSKRIKFRGLDVSIEQDEGEIREWTDAASGTKGRTKMRVPYGYIRRTEGMDGDHVDVFIGPYENADNVYVIHQMKLPDFKKFDEDKCMLGFGTAEEAKAMYLNHFNDDRFFGSMTTMPFTEFKQKVLATFEAPKKLAGALQYPQESSMSLSRVLRQFAKTSAAKTLEETTHEVQNISRKLRGFARRHVGNAGDETAHNLASKTLDDLPAKAAAAAIYDLQTEKAAQQLKRAGLFSNWFGGGQGTSTVAQNYHPDTVQRARDMEQGRAPSVARPQLPPQILNAQGAPANAAPAAAAAPATQRAVSAAGGQPSSGPARNQWAFDAGARAR